MGVAEDRAAWEQWRRERDAEFARPHGWLSLTALHWLDEEPEALDELPGRWWADDRGIHHEPDPAAEPVLVAGVPVASASLLWDPTAGAAPRVTHGERRLELLQRDRLVGVRVRDPQAPALRSFTGIPAFPHDPSWRIVGRFRPYPEVRQQGIGSAAAGVSFQAQVLGELDLVVAGRPQTLKVTGADGHWLVSFRDATSGRETAGACRWVWLDAAPRDEVVVDFNRAANPPCAFSDFGTCPLPPAGNTLDVAVLAGERNPRPRD